MDPYKILGIERDASKEDIRKAYRSKAAKYHPDSGGDDWIFKQIQDAYNELTDVPGDPDIKNDLTPVETDSPYATVPAKPFWGNEDIVYDRQVNKQNASLIWALVVLTAAILLGVFWPRPESIDGVNANADWSKSETPTFDELSNSPIVDLGFSQNEIEEIVVDPSPASNPEPNSRDRIKLAFASKPIIHFSFEENRFFNYKVWDGDKKEYVSINRGAEFTTGIAGRGLQIPPDKFIEIAGQTPAGDSPRTVAVWIKKDESSGEGYIFRSGEHFGFKYAFQHWVFVESFLEIRSKNNVDNEWHHHCVTYDENWVRYFVDGVLVDNRQVELNTLAGPIIFGSSNTEDFGGFNGVIDELVVYDRALEHKHVKEIFRFGKRGKQIPFKSKTN